MSIELHLLNATKKLDPYIEKLQAAFESTVNKVQVLLPISDVDVVMYSSSFYTLPETGVGGFSPSAEIAFVYLNPFNEHFEGSIKTEVVATLAHELYHCMRWLGPGYGTNLGDALVSEGLAQHFEAEFRGSPPFYSLALKEPELRKLFERAEPVLMSADYSHWDWFSGSEKLGIPKYGGYSLGFHIVSKALYALQATVIELWREPSASFLEKWTPPEENPGKAIG